MRHCLREGRYNHAAVLGRLAMFSIKSCGHRATLALKPIEEVTFDGNVRVERWEISEFRGRVNCEPSDACKEAANSLLRRLNQACPVLLPESELRRRTKMRDMMDHSRTFNRDLRTANERWLEIYAMRLPPKLAAISPADVVNRYLLGRLATSYRSARRD